jgi:SAM-dependent methyltransferase
VQADVRSLLLAAPLHLAEGDLRDVVLESPVGDRRRIDVETGTTVIEVKRDLRRGGVRDEAVAQLAGYVEAREREMERRYVGVVTDGAEWVCYHLAEDGLAQASALQVRGGRDLDALLVWLEGVLATAQDIPPTPAEIHARLGAGSSSHALDQATLRSLYAQHRDEPSVRMKRRLWARLLTTALGSQFVDSDELFVEHTLLVNTAEIIAHAVLGLDVRTISPASLLTGAKFAEHGIYGVVESDFFDWVMDVPRGQTFVRSLARGLARFDWSAVEHDVLKVLYQSVITAETRKRLGEYYTPDWLAEAMVEETIRAPLEQSVLDPSCGSGTFLFHAVRRFLAAADAAGRSTADALDEVSRRVVGMDLHPVAVTLARVTYVLALGSERLSDPERGQLQIPVYLGDSMQWQQKAVEIFTAGYLVIQVDGEDDLSAHEIRFPERLLADARHFDRLVEELTRRATNRTPGSPVPRLSGVFQRLGVAEEDREAVTETFRTLCLLHDEGRNHIWGYYVRNLARPVWLALPQHRIDTLIGNPPWLAYRHMTPELQAKFREMSESRGLWKGAKVATHQDLSDLFVARVVQLYLRKGGRFAFVLPNAALDRAQFAGFRAGNYPDPVEPVHLAFDTSWDLRRLRPHFFPRGASVVFGQRVSDRGRGLPATAEAWSGALPREDASWGIVAERVERSEVALQPMEEEVESPYRLRFRQGASVVPRVLFLVEERPPGPLGLPRGFVVVRSVRSAYEKRPWKDLESREGVVESEFVYPLYLGEHVLPYRTLPPARAVLPWQEGRLPHGEHPFLDQYEKMGPWWRQAEELWLANRSSERLTLAERLDFHGELTAQHPTYQRRLLYTKSGMHLCASLIDHHRAMVDHKLYWATILRHEEGRFLNAILNSAQATQLVRPLMSYGKDERDIDKHIWRLPIPSFDAENELHAELASLAAEVEQEIRGLELDETRNFVTLRQQLRRFLKKSPKGRAIEELVTELLS